MFRFTCGTIVKAGSHSCFALLFIVLKLNNFFVCLWERVQQIYMFIVSRVAITFFVFRFFTCLFILFFFFSGKSKNQEEKDDGEKEHIEPLF